ncbi:hypothetical protein GO308_09785 [Sphingomonas sp. SFZ2018-12]|uniref:hypothetical protein n=1 Tax=Sphingomonas sp. SFZ2018-12 TaxID=2683197 RepID=UPI001F103A22|nr:hypothetical protein [Sphingomonas sp. SFZ2018-12]MCH4893399.1 hypothetical protein [Sphingomonas sp. SFZ2018-12]
MSAYHGNSAESCSQSVSSRDARIVGWREHARRLEWVMSNRVVPGLIGLALAIFSQGLWS